MTESDPIAPISEVVLYKKETEANSFLLKASIHEDGRFTLDGSDFGKLPQETFGRDEYEYHSSVKAKYKDTMLLLLIQDRFKGSSDFEFKQWLKEKGIPFQFACM